MKEKLMTVLTATLGRPSLEKVKEQMEKQTVAKKLHWLVIADGKVATEKATEILAGVQVSAAILTYEKEKPRGAWQYGMLFEGLKHVKTPYVCIVDDDNGFKDNHVEKLLEGLIGHPYVATNRIYTDSTGNFIGDEHPLSELVDSNNAGFSTEFFKAVAKAWQALGSNPFHCDRDIQMIAQLLGVIPKRVNTYTVLYRINENRCSFETFRTTGKQRVFETLGGMVIKT